MINNPTGSQANRRVFLSPRAHARPAHLRHADGRHPGVARQDADQPRRAARRLRRRHPGHAHERRHPERQPDRPAAAGASRAPTTARATSTSSSPTVRRHVVARDEGHPGLLQPRLAGHGRRSPNVGAEVPRSRGRRSRRTTCSRPATRSGSSSSRTTSSQLGRSTARRGTTVTLDTRVSKVRLPVDGRLPGGGRVRRASRPTRWRRSCTACRANIAVDTESGDGRTVTYTPPTATDNEDPAPVVACAPPSGANFGVGTTEVACTATDASGNSTSATFTVTVRWVDDERRRRRRRRCRRR